MLGLSAWLALLQDGLDHVLCSSFAVRSQRTYPPLGRGGIVWSSEEDSGTRVTTGETSLQLIFGLSPAVCQGSKLETSCC